VVNENDKKEFSTAINCITLANDEDFLLLRREMVAAESELKMIDIAMNSLIKKCWKADQIKNLAVLLLNDDNRFEFIKMSKIYLVDKQQFVNMLPLMTTEKNINNFKALLN
jgi:predicted HTH transcriptional regulator